MNDHSYLSISQLTVSTHHLAEDPTCRIIHLDLPGVMQPRETLQDNCITSLTNPALPEDARSPRLKAGYKLTFVDSQQGIRRLSAENAAKHRHAIFTGVLCTYPDDLPVPDIL